MNKRGKLLFVFLICASILICLLGFYLNHNFYQDDSFITLRYARNFLNGHGIVWNPGERVEGYSNFLFLMLVSLLGKFGVDLVAASRIIGVSSFVLLVLFVAWYFKTFSFSKKDSDERFLNFIPVFLTITSFPLIIWSVGGLEGTLLTLFTTIGIFLVVKAVDAEKKGVYLAVSSFAFAMAAMTRLDSGIFMAISCGFLIYLYLTKKGVSLKHVLSFLFIFLIIFVPYFMWRWNYYGDILPNAFYVKADGFNVVKAYSGLKYIAYYCASPPFIFFIFSLFMLLNFFHKKWNVQKSYLTTIVVSYAGYVFYVGGDHMQAHRFLLSIIPISVLLLYLMIESFKNYFHTQEKFVVYYTLMFLVLIQCLYPVTNVRKMDPAAFLGKIVGEYIAKNWPKGSLIALSTAGAPPYFAPDNKYIDMLGINDAHIAKRKILKVETYCQVAPGHSKGDGKYVLSRKPNYIILGPAQGTTPERPYFLSDIEIANDPRFTRDYVLRQVEINIEHVPEHEKYFASSCLGIITFTYYERKLEDQRF